jgi:hypothetical protein
MSISDATLRISSISMQAESMVLMERTIREVCKFPNLGLFEESRIIVNVDAQGMETVFVDGVAVLEFGPMEVAYEVGNDSSRVVASRKWRKL